MVMAVADEFRTKLEIETRRIRAGGMIYKVAVLLAMPIDRALFDTQVEIMKTACDEYLTAVESLRS